MALSWAYSHFSWIYALQEALDTLLLWYFISSVMPLQLYFRLMQHGSTLSWEIVWSCIVILADTIEAVHCQQSPVRSWGIWELEYCLWLALYTLWRNPIWILQLEFIMMYSIAKTYGNRILIMMAVTGIGAVISEICSDSLFLCLLEFKMIFIP